MIQKAQCVFVLLGIVMLFCINVSQAQTSQSLITSTAQSSNIQESLDAELPLAPEPNFTSSLNLQQSETNQQSKPDQQNKPESSPTLTDLGFSDKQIQSDANLQALLNKRSHMLKIHQTLGLWTVLPLGATLITGPMAHVKGKKGETLTEPTPINLDTHIALGGLTTAMYWTTAYYSIFAPKIPGVQPKGAIRLHRALEWVHGPGMLMTPILGVMAYKQENAGEKVHGIASMHGPVAYTTAIAYGASIIAVSWPIHWKFWEK